MEINPKTMALLVVNAGGLWSTVVHLASN